MAVSDHDSLKGELLSVVADLAQMSEDLASQGQCQLSGRVLGARNLLRLMGSKMFPEQEDRTAQEAQEAAKE